MLIQLLVEVNKVKENLDLLKSFFSRREQRKILFSILLQFSLSVLDLLGVAIIGFIGALTITGIQSRQPLGKVSKLLGILQIDTLSFQLQIVILGVLGASVLMIRTILSIIITRKMLFFLGKKTATESSDLIHAILFTSPAIWRSKSDQEILYYITIGIRSLFLGVVGSAISLIVDIFLLLLLFVGLLVVDFYVAITSTAIFSITGIILHKILGKRAKILGAAEAELNIRSNEKIIESLSTYREIFVKGRRNYYFNEIRDTRTLLSRYFSEQTFMPNINKYVIETTLIVSAIILSSVQFLIHDASHAIAILSIFLAASARLTPAILRIQQNLLFIKGSLSSTRDTQLFARSIQQNRKHIKEREYEKTSREFNGSIIFRNVKFEYSTESTFKIRNFNLDIKKGEHIAIAGKSGSGKTTVIDLLLGIIKPLDGDILISNWKPEIAIAKFPGRIAYVPQQTVIVNGSIRKNIALGFEENFFTDDEIWKALELSNLKAFILDLDDKLNYEVGENGNNLSGGQKQRLGIARALITNPELIILDEATSSLDAESESLITRSINDLKGQKTIVTIAHRYATIKNADRIVYMDNGNVLGIGSFEELKNTISDFEKQASLMGL